MTRSRRQFNSAMGYQTTADWSKRRAPLLHSGGAGALPASATKQIHITFLNKYKHLIWVTDMKYDEDKVREEIAAAPAGTKVYFGCDSRRYKRKNGEWWASYATVIVLHISGSKGCRVFGLLERERDYSGSMKMRLLKEVHKAVEMVLRFEEDLILNDIEYEVHLDINSDAGCKSNVAMKEALGYVLGTVGIRPLFKPDAFASSCAADCFEYKDTINPIPRRKVRSYLQNQHKATG